MTARADDFNFRLVGPYDEPFGGYVSTNDPTNMAPNLLTRGSKNTYKNLSQRIQIREGRKRRGTGDPTEDGIKSAYDWYDSLGRTFPVRVLASGKLQFESDIVTAGTYVWYTIYTDADHTRYCFAPWWDNDQQKDLLTMVKGDHDILVWSGGIAIGGTSGTSSAAASVNTTVFSNAGTGYQIGDLVSIGNGTSAVVEITAIGGGGAASQIRLNNGGFGFSATGDSATTAIKGTGSGLIVNVTALSAVTTLTTSDGQDWARKGFLTQGQDGLISRSVIIGGTEYTYNGISGSTMYGLSDATLGAGAVVFQAPIITTDTPSADFVNDFNIVNGNQLIIGSYTSRAVYASDDTNYTTFGNGGTQPGSAFMLTLDNVGRGFAVRQGSLQVSAGTADWYEVTITTNYVTFSNSATQVQNIAVSKKPGAPLSAALGQEFIVNVGDDVYYVAQDHQLYVYGSFTNQFNQRFPMLSQDIRDELSDADMTGGALAAVTDSLYLTVPVSGQTFIYSARQFVDASGNIQAERLWYAPQIWNISRISVIDGVIYGTSSENPQYYQLFNTGQYYDDTPTTSKAPYEGVARFTYWNFSGKDGTRATLGDLSKLFFEGYIDPNSELSVTMRLNYQGATEELTEVISGLSNNPVLYSSAGVVPIGTGKVGDELIGGGGPDEFGGAAFPKFRVIPTFKKFEVFEYQFELYSFSSGSRWELIAVGSNGSAVINNPVVIQKND